MHDVFRTHKPSLTALCAVLLLTSTTAYADNVCKTPDGFVFNGFTPTGGIGGTGHEDRKTGTGGIGGTGHEQDIPGTGNGMGGTGAKHTENGIGGTGKPLEVAVYGRITGFGSICVNGMEVHYKPNTPVTVDSRRADIHDLKVGQIVSLVALQNTKGDFYTRDISVHSVLTGPIEHIDTRSHTVQVLGQTVRTESVSSKLSVGDTVRVSGLRDGDNKVVATLIEKMPAAVPNIISGTVRVADGTTYIGSTPITSSHEPRNGEFVQAKGTWEDGKFVASAITAQPNPENIHGVSLFSIQTYTGKAGLDHDKDQRVILFGTSNGKGVFTPEKIIEEKSAIHPVLEKETSEENEPLKEEHADHKSDHREEQAADHDSSNKDEHEDHDRPEDIVPEAGSEDLTAHETESPEIEQPEAETPEIEEPEVETPEVETPEIEAPEIEAPEIEAPEIEIPEVETPEIELPEIEEPELPD